GSPAQAQEYPSKAITITLVLAAGTGLDVVARTWGEQIAQALGKPVVFDNRPGANGIVAINALKNAPADGHALLVGTSAALALNQTTYKQLPYDSAKDFIPVSLYLKSPFVLIVHPSLPVRSVNELAAYVKARPGQLSYSSTGPGGAPRLATEMFAQHFGLNIIHVPYKNSPQAIMDIAAGHVQLGFAEAGASQHLIRDKRLRALAVSTLTRFNSLPEVPTLAEAAARPGLEAVSWHALVAPSQTPRAVVNRLHGEMARILKMPDVNKTISNLDLIPVAPVSIEEHQQYIAAETKKWGALITKLGLAGSQ
ncbi:MAG: tripartite tricarboxylate transporter substrate binding protein, partial [Burkholderiales bacterium]